MGDFIFNAIKLRNLTNEIAVVFNPDNAILNP